jgi:hypothetical protein
MSEPSDQQSLSEALRQTSERALSGSAVINTTRAISAHIGHYVRASFLYRWLTAEPDPEVIVIDLRETWTVGPVLAVIEKVLTELDRARTGSHIESLLETTTTALRTSPVRIIGTVVATLGATLTIATLLTSGGRTSVVVGLVVLLVGVIATRDDRDWETLRETQLVEILRRVLEPPAPPADTENDGSRDTRTKDVDQATDADRAK